MIDSNFHIANRRRITEIFPDSLIVLTAYSKMQRSNDEAFSFKQEANFWWLTGIEQHDWRVIIDSKQNKSWLVSPDISSAHKTFDGSLSFDDAVNLSGVDGVLTRDESAQMLAELAKNNDVVYTVQELVDADRFSFVMNPALKKLQTELETLFTDVKDCRTELSKLRSIKQSVEIEEIKKAIKLTTDAFNEIKPKLMSLNYEYEAEAEFTYHFRKNGSDHAFTPIVAGGKNACTLHYIDNNSPVSQGSLLLFDIGAQIGGYSSDISRTYAVGTPTERQIAVHDAVRQVHDQTINLLKPGLKITDYNQQVDVIMQNALKKLGLLSSPDDYRQYFPHSISHGLGVDTHDSLGKPEEFLPGMVITVEPGIYIPSENIGVRIEDDILITKTGYENLSAELSTDM